MTDQLAVIDGKAFVVGETYGPGGQCWGGVTRAIESFGVDLRRGRYVVVRHPGGGTRKIKLSSFATWARGKVKTAP